MTAGSAGEAGERPRMPEPRLRHIDALRAIAALLVLWLHVSEVYVGLAAGGRLPGSGLHDIASMLGIGRVGVVAFFLISGFVIPFSIRADRPAPVGTFLIKRFFRIFPAYWLSIPLGALTGFWLWGKPFGARDFLVNLTLLQDFFGIPGAEGLYWTLLVELLFYALCVVLLLAGSLFDMRRVCALAIALGFVHAAATVASWAGAPLMPPTFAFGLLNLSIMLCGTLYRSCIVGTAARDDAWLRFGVRGLFAYYLVVLPAGAVWAVGVHDNAALSYALGLLVFVLGASVVRIATRLTDWLGRVSYSIYLLHPVVLYALLWWLLRQPQGSWWRTRHLGWYLLVNAGLTVALATIVYRLVEQPGIRLGRRCADAWMRRGSRASPAGGGQASAVAGA